MSGLTVKRLEIPDVLKMIAAKFEDERGYFIETYNAREFAASGIAATFIQDNQSLSTRPGTIRGLHFQLPPRGSSQARAGIERIDLRRRGGHPARLA